jgi:hypothetical protein
MNKPKRAALVLNEVAGKRISRLTMEEPYPNSHEVYIAIEFEDKTELVIEVDSRPFFDIRHLARNAEGELEPVKKPRRGSIRSLGRVRQ